MDAARPPRTDHPLSTCHEVVFQRAHARIEVFERADAQGLGGFAAQIWLIEDDGAVRHLLVDAAGEPIEIHGPSASTTLSAAITFLESHYGAQTQYAYECVDFDTRPTVGEVARLE